MAYSAAAKQRAWDYLNSLQYIACRDQFYLPRTPKRWVVMHEMVSPETSSMAENLGNYFRNPRNPDGSPRYASTHFGVDNDSAVRYAEYYYKVYGAAGANENGWHIEQAGSGTQEETDWFDSYSKAMLDGPSSKLCAALCIIDDIPVQYVNQNGLVAGIGGITTHIDTCEAFLAGRQNQWHFDPVNYPINYFIEQVKRQVALFEGQSPKEDEMAEAKDEIIAAIGDVRRDLGKWLKEQTDRAIEEAKKAGRNSRHFPWIDGTEGSGAQYILVFDADEETGAFLYHIKSLEERDALIDIGVINPHETPTVTDPARVASLRKHPVINPD